MKFSTITIFVLGSFMAFASYGADSVLISIPLKVEGETVLDSPMSISVLSEKLAFAFEMDSPPDNRSSVRGVCWGIVDAAMREDFDAFINLSAPDTTSDELKGYFRTYVTIVENQRVFFERAFFIDEVCVVWAGLNNRKTVGGFVLMKELEKGRYGQNVSLAYEAIPQAIQFAINLGNDVAPRFIQDEPQTLLVSLGGTKPTELALMEVYVSGISVHEKLFNNKYGLALSTIVDSYFKIYSSIGTDEYTPRLFGEASHKKIEQQGGIKRWIPEERKVFLCVISKTQFLILSLDPKSNELHYGYLVQGAGDSFRLVNFQRRTPAERLLELSPVAEALASYFEKEKQNPVLKQVIESVPLHNDIESISKEVKESVLFDKDHDSKVMDYKLIAVVLLLVVLVVVITILRKKIFG